MPNESCGALVPKNTSYVHLRDDSSMASEQCLDITPVSEQHSAGRQSCLGDAQRANSRRTLGAAVALVSALRRVAIGGSRVVRHRQEDVLRHSRSVTTPRAGR